MHSPLRLVASVASPLACLLVAACSGSSTGTAEAHDDAGGVADDGGGKTSHSGSTRGSASAGASSSGSSTRGTSSSSGGATGASSGKDGGSSKGDAATGSAAAQLTAAPDDTWTWIPLPGMSCGNGSSTGIGWNPHGGATQLLIYLQGGGACFDADSCWGASPTASNMTGYAAADFASDPTVDAEIFQRTTSGNPFKDANLVFVPYCTGDLHVGTGLVSYSVSGVATPTYFHGADNVDAVSNSLAAYAASQKPLSRIFLTGVSAGGFGTFLNQDEVARAFGSVRVDVVDDSGPALSGTGIPTDWSARLPPGCTNCTDANTVFQYTRATYPDSRYGFMTFQTDTVLPLFFGDTDAQFAMLLQTFVSSLSSDPNTKAFVDTSSGHVVLEETDATAKPFILPWLTQLATDDPAWATVSH